MVLDEQVVEEEVIDTLEIFDELEEVASNWYWIILILNDLNICICIICCHWIESIISFEFELSEIFESQKSNKEFNDSKTNTDWI